MIGSALAEFFHFVVVDPAQERRDDFLRETMERLVASQASYNQLSAEHLRENEQFQAALLQAARDATATASAEKRRTLQNAVINSAIANWEESDRLKMMDALDRLTPAHIAMMLRISAAPRQIEEQRQGQ